MTLHTLSSRLRRVVAVAVLAATVAGCSTMVETRRDARAGIQSGSTEAERLLAQRPQAVPAVGPIISDLPYVDVTPFRRKGDLPSVFDRQVTLNEPLGVSLQSLAQRVGAMTGLNVAYASELVADAKGVPMPMPARIGDGADSSLAGLPPLGPALAQVGTVSSPDTRATVAISYTGSLSGLLDAIAAATGSAWKYRPQDRAVQFYRYELRSFRVPAVPGDATTSGSIGGMNQTAQAGYGIGGGAISQARVEAEHKVGGSVWQGIEVAVKQLLSPEGSYSLSPQTGMLVVRDRPDRIAQVADYMADIDRALSRQVDIEVNVYRVQLNQQDERGLNWNLIYNRLRNTSPIPIDFTFSTVGARPNTDGSFGTSIFSVKTRGPDGNMLPFGGTQAFLDALSTVGNASIVTNTSVVTSNNTPVPVKVVRRNAYLASVTSNYTNVGGQVTNAGPTLTPGMIETGLNMLLLPNVQDDGKRVLLKVMLSYSALESITSYGTESASIQLPNTASREFTQQAWLDNGDLLVLAGFRQTDDGIDNKGPTDSWLLGGSSRARKNREVIVVTLRPIVTSARADI